MAARLPCEHPVLRAGSATYAVDRERITIGRSRSCDIRIDEETVSRRHAVLVRHDGALRIEDLGSSNGTFVNGERIRDSEDVAVGDVIRVGGVVLTLGDDSSPPPDPRTVEQGPDYSSGLVLGPPAGPLRRVLALALDMVLFVAGSAVPFAPLLVAAGVERYLLLPDVIPPAEEVWIAIASGCTALWLVYAWYYVVHGWARRGGTPGLRLLGLRLIDWRHRVPIGYVRAWLRLLAFAVTLATFGIGLLTVFLRRDRKALHDLLAGTLVVRRLA